MFAAILVLVGIAGLATHWLYRNFLRRPERLKEGMPVMLSGWTDGHESMVAVHLRRRPR
ncbi:hypothetical protein SAMN05192549_101621 [Duganella sacchari]|uniref:Uncharacterized protein n=1 Tax=Duganella sacchari TaxID=551987 RepID=A0A1M7IX25_9BURK|nr:MULTISPECIES: hypothetical protein [Duganella]MYM26797.1 hypothetical protein [Duganella sp. CY15W]SHM45225.1 hypothetical protein SAMN05192549_101621 [Duganella sacchari]